MCSFAYSTPTSDTVDKDVFFRPAHEHEPAHDKFLYLYICQILFFQKKYLAYV